jgi:protoporphyrinogen/coproporphyrinogen III oxidase
MTDIQEPDRDQLLDVLVVGGGISGLTIAYSLNQNRAEKLALKICLTESSDRVGGAIISRRNSAGFQWEEGPNSFSPTPEILGLAVKVGLKDRLLFADRRLPRFIYWQKQLLAVPMSPQAAIATPLLSFGGKLRALIGAIGFARPAMDREESIADFFKRQLGDEVAERLVAPFVSGVYAGDPNQLSMGAAFRRLSVLEENYGGLLAGAILARKSAPKTIPNPNIPKTKPGELGSFQAGLEALPQAIAQIFTAQNGEIKLAWQLQSITRNPDLTYQATYLTPSGFQILNARAIVLTTAAYVTAKLLADIAPVASEALSSIFYPTVAAVALAYPQSAFKPELEKLDGFGNLIPRGQGIRTLGTIWGSSLFSDRAPQGWNLLLNFIGGTTDPVLANLTEDQIVEAVDRDLQNTLLRSPVSPQVLSVHLWSKAIPQYSFGHRSRIAKLKDQLQKLPGLYVSSNFLEGVALGDCIKQAEQTAIAVTDYLETKA